MISYRMLGSLDNCSVLRFYHHNKVDCFLHLSRSEGGPLVIVEAESAGIPIISTDVGLASEAIDGNGVLLPVDSEPDIIADSIITLLSKPEEEKTRMRIASRKIWEQKFNAATNASYFVRMLGEIGGDRNNIILITEGFPFYKDESSFICSELLEMLKHYNVKIIARIRGSITADMWENYRNALSFFRAKINNNDLTVIPYIEFLGMFNKLKHLIRFFTDRRIIKERKTIVDSKDRLFIRTWESVKYYASGAVFFEWLCRQNLLGADNTDKTIIYTYWNLQPTLGICLNRRMLGNVRIITRMHGYDYIDEQWLKSHRKPFTEVVDQLIDNMIFASKKGLDYHVIRHSSPNEYGKYRYSYLGSVDSIESKKTQKAKKNNGSHDVTPTYRIVSCSNLVPVKRVDLIIDSLARVQEKKPDMDIEWVHFGDGPLMSDLRDYASNSLHQ